LILLLKIPYSSKVHYFIGRREALKPPSRLSTKSCFSIAQFAIDNNKLKSRLAIKSCLSITQLGKTNSKQHAMASPYESQLEHIRQAALIDGYAHATFWANWSQVINFVVRTKPDASPDIQMYTAEKMFFEKNCEAPPLPFTLFSKHGLITLKGTNHSGVKIQGPST
jgi:hypothetical protein